MAIPNVCSTYCLLVNEDILLQEMKNVLHYYDEEVAKVYSQSYHD